MMKNYIYLEGSTVEEFAESIKNELGQDNALKLGGLFGFVTAKAKVLTQEAEKFFYPNPVPLPSWFDILEVNDTYTVTYLGETTELPLTASPENGTIYRFQLTQSGGFIRMPLYE